MVTVTVAHTLNIVRRSLSLQVPCALDVYERRRECSLI